MEEQLEEAGHRHTQGGARVPFRFYLSLLFGRRLNGDRGRFWFPRRGRKGAAGALVAVVAQFVGSSGSWRLQLRVQLAVGRGGRGCQHQRLERCHLRLQDVDLRVGRGETSVSSRHPLVHQFESKGLFTLARPGTVRFVGVLHASVTTASAVITKDHLQTSQQMLPPNDKRVPREKNICNNIVITL